MTAARIYTGAEASKLLSALCANRTPAPWHVGDRVLTDELNDVRVIQSADRDSVGHVWASAFDGDHDDIALAAAATLAAAAPDLAASVAHHAERADKAEAEVKSAVDRLVGLVGDRAPLADMIRAVEDGIRTMEVERDAANARADASGAVLRAAVEVLDGGETSPADLPAALGEYLRGVGAQVAAAMASDRQASETCADLRRQLLAVTAERDRLARVLAVERGDQTLAPPGWVRFGDAGWRRVADNVIIQRHSGEALDVWERRGIRRDDPRHRRWDSALEAMEAIDAVEVDLPA